MTKAPPGRFSMMKDWPSSFDSPCARMRAPLSVALPGACGTTSFMARSGYCACADVAKAAAHVRLTNKSCFMRIGFPFRLRFGLGTIVKKTNSAARRGKDGVDALAPAESTRPDTARDV